MTPKQAWKKLGIEPTGDKRAVKRAYAAKLKAIDPDKDPKAFLALRDALQTATWQAEHLSYGGEADTSDDVQTEELRSEAEIIAELTSQNGGIGPMVLNIQDDPVGEDQYDDDDDWDDYEAPHHSFAEDDPRARISALLWNDTATPVDAPALIEATRALLNDPQMENVDHQSEIEDWLGWTLAQAVPRADAVIPMVVDHFRWHERINLVGQNYFIISCATRADDLACIARLKNPTHRWHKAFSILSSPAPSSLSFVDKVRYKNDIAALLESLKTHNPGVEMSLDEDHVTLWHFAKSKPSAGEHESGMGCSWYTWFLAAWFIFQVLRAIAGSSPSSPEPVVVPNIPLNSTEIIRNRIDDEEMERLRNQVFEDVKRRKEAQDREGGETADQTLKNLMEEARRAREGQTSYPPAPSPPPSPAPPSAR